jgi:hypothetical protein
MTLEDYMMSLSNKLHNHRIDLGKVLVENEDISDEPTIKNLDKVNILLQEAEYILDKTLGVE